MALKDIITKFESSQASSLGVSIDRILRRRHRDTQQHAYNTRRSDVAGDTEDDQPSTSKRRATERRDEEERGDSMIDSH